MSSSHQVKKQKEDYDLENQYYIDMAIGNYQYCDCTQILQEDLYHLCLNFANNTTTFSWAKFRNYNFLKDLLQQFQKNCELVCFVGLQSNGIAFNKQCFQKIQEQLSQVLLYYNLLQEITGNKAQFSDFEKLDLYLGLIRIIDKDGYYILRISTDFRSNNVCKSYNQNLNIDDYTIKNQLNYLNYEEQKIEEVQFYGETEIIEEVVERLNGISGFRDIGEVSYLSQQKIKIKYIYSAEIQQKIEAIVL